MDVKLMQMKYILVTGVAGFIGFHLKAIEVNCNKDAILEMYPMQPGDVFKTYADITKLNRATGYDPSTNIDKGTEAFVSWYKRYYGE